LRSSTRYFVDPEPIALADAAVVQVRGQADLSTQSPPLVYSHAAEAAASLTGSQLVHLGVAP
jgi:hypothetical protein